MIGSNFYTVHDYYITTTSYTQYFCSRSLSFNFLSSSVISVTFSLDALRIAFDSARMLMSQELSVETNFRQTTGRPAVPPRHSRVTSAASRSSQETGGPEIRGRERIGTRCPRRSRRRGCGSRDGTPSQSPASATPAQPDADRRRESVSTCDLTTINTIIN